MEDPAGTASSGFALTVFALVLLLWSSTKWGLVVSDTVALLFIGAVVSAVAIGLYCVNTIRAGREIHGENLSNISRIDSDKETAIAACQEAMEEICALRHALADIIAADAGGEGTADFYRAIDKAKKLLQDVKPDA